MIAGEYDPARTPRGHHQFIHRLLDWRFEKSMSRVRESMAADHQLAIPWDLSEWHKPALLLQWILEDVEALDWANPELVAYLAAHRSYQPKLLLCLLAYSYATGVYESEEIVRSFYQDDGLRREFGGAGPEAQAIAKFRRENRGLLKWCLVHLFKRALRAKFELGDLVLPAGLRKYLVDAAITRIDIARHMDRGSREG